MTRQPALILLLAVPIVTLALLTAKLPSAQLTRLWPLLMAVIRTVLFPGALDLISIISDEFIALNATTGQIFRIQKYIAL